jgi:hypothetical protein
MELALIVAGLLVYRARSALMARFSYKFDSEAGLPVICVETRHMPVILRCRTSADAIATGVDFSRRSSRSTDLFREEPTCYAFLYQRVSS